MKLIFHITHQESCKEVKTNGFYTAPSLISEGFIHCSTGPQICHSANLYFQGQTDLVLLVINTELLSSKLVFEGETQNVFPHVYGSIPESAIIEIIPLANNEDGHFVLPKRVKEICSFYKDLKNLLEMAESEPTLRDFVQSANENLNRLPIWKEEKIVGFATPRQERDGIWRMGAIYIHPEYRGLGLASTAIREFIKFKQARAFLEDNNFASQKAFWSAGFKPYQYNKSLVGAWWSNYSYKLKAKAVKDYEVCYKNPVRIQTEEKIKIVKSEDRPDWKGWHFCETPDGNAGWISEFYFNRLDQNTAVTLFPYEATELPLKEGQEVYIYNQDRGWAWCSDIDQTTEGWVPIENLF